MGTRRLLRSILALLSLASLAGSTDTLADPAANPYAGSFETSAPEPEQDTKDDAGPSRTANFGTIGGHVSYGTTILGEKRSNDYGAGVSVGGDAFTINKNVTTKFSGRASATGGNNSNYHVSFDTQAKFNNAKKGFALSMIGLGTDGELRGSVKDGGVDLMRVGMSAEPVGLKYSSDNDIMMILAPYGRGGFQISSGDQIMEVGGGVRFFGAVIDVLELELGAEFSRYIYLGDLKGIANDFKRQVSTYSKETQVALSACTKATGEVLQLTSDAAAAIDALASGMPPTSAPGSGAIKDAVANAEKVCTDAGKKSQNLPDVSGTETKDALKGLAGMRLYARALWKVTDRWALMASGSYSKRDIPVVVPHPDGPPSVEAQPRHDVRVDVGAGIAF